MCCAALCCVVLYCAVPCRAVPCCAVRCAVLRRVVLRPVVLHFALRVYCFAPGSDCIHHFQGAPYVLEQLQRLRLSAIWALMVVFPKGRLIAPFEGAFVEGDERLAWAANNTAKNQSGEEDAWTLFSTPEYGRANKVPQVRGPLRFRLEEGGGVHVHQVCPPPPLDTAINDPPPFLKETGLRGGGSAEHQSAGQRGRAHSNWT